MSVMVVTSLGEIVIDLYADRCPLTCKNFLKLCKIKYYNGCLFHEVQKDFTARTGDPTGTGSGGDSVYRYLYGEQARFFKDEIHPELKHSKIGTVAMANAGENLNASQFYITLREGLDYLDGKHTVFGEVAEGHDTLERINEAYVDDNKRPYKNIRIKHTYILDDPFEDPPQLAGLIPDASPEGKPKEEVDDEVRLEDDWVPMDENFNADELEEVIREKEAHSRAVVLESIGDIPDADVKPPENVLFVCKLNPATEDGDLETIFSRFGNVTSAEIIRDFKTGDSLCYAFIEFEDEEACIQAYKKMDNALIDDRRIKVDFSQSVSKLWNQFRRKGSKQGQGCFKCGSPEHVAKDCPGSSTTKNQRNFELKEDNKQHGGQDNAKYDMVFDEDSGSPRPEKRRHERDNPSRKHELSRRSSEGTKNKEDSVDRHWRGNRSRVTREVEDHDDGARRESRGRRDRDYDEKPEGRRVDREHGRKDHRDYHGRRDADNGKDREDGRNERKRNADLDDRQDDRKRRTDDDRYGDREDPSHRRSDRDRGSDSHRSRREERERRSPDRYGDRRDHDRRQRRDRR